MKQELIKKAERLLTIARIAHTKGEKETWQEKLKEAKALYEAAGMSGMVKFCERWIE